MAEQPLEMEEEGADLPDGLFPPDDSDDDGLTPPAAEDADTGGNRRGGPILLRERYLVDPSARLPDMDQPSAKAYAVEDRRDLSVKLYALACTPSLPARMDVIRAMMDKTAEEVEDNPNGDGLGPSHSGRYDVRVRV